MGSINKRPIAPVQPIYYNLGSSSQPSVDSATTDPVKTEEQISTEGRKQSLLRRSRGTLGTVLTSFRGFLTSSDRSEGSTRKTLLGE